MIMDDDEETGSSSSSDGGSENMQIDAAGTKNSSGDSMMFRMEDFDPFIAEAEKIREDRITGKTAQQARNNRLFNPPAILEVGGHRPQSPSEAELDVVQQALQADYKEVRDIFEWALRQLPNYGEVNAASMNYLLRVKSNTPCLALCRAGFLIILSNSQRVRKEASSGYVANRIYHRIPEQKMHQFFKSKIVNDARRQYVISADGTGLTKDARAARSVLFVNRLRNMVAKGGVEGFMLAMNISC